MALVPIRRSPSASMDSRWGASRSGPFRTLTIRLIAICSPGPRMHCALGAADDAGESEPLHTGRVIPGHYDRHGAAYPYLEVEPKAYRFRVLNASNDVSSTSSSMWQQTEYANHA